MPVKTFDDLIDMLTVQADNIGTYKADLDATVAEQTAITEDLANLVYIRDFVETFDADKKSVTKIKQDLFNGDQSKPISAFPTFAAGALPFPNAEPNALSRHNATNARWKTAPGYTEQIGLAMAIVSPPPSNVIPGDVKPTINVFAAANNHHFSVVVSGREQADSWEVWIQRKGGGWTKAAFGTGKSADVDVALTTPGEAEQILVRVQLRKANADYGQVSEPAYVTLNP